MSGIFSLFFFIGSPNVFFFSLQADSTVECLTATRYRWERKHISNLVSSHRESLKSLYSMMYDAIDLWNLTGFRLHFGKFQDVSTTNKLQKKFMNVLNSRY